MYQLVIICYCRTANRHAIDLPYRSSTLRARVTYMRLMLSTESQYISLNRMQQYYANAIMFISDLLYQHRVAIDGATSEVEVLDTCGCAVNILITLSA